MFARVNAANWVDDVSPLTVEQVNPLDVNITRAIDGAAGGLYAPKPTIGIAGAGLTIGILGDAVPNRLRYVSRSLARNLNMLIYAGPGNWARDLASPQSWIDSGIGSKLWIAIEPLQHDALAPASRLTIVVRFRGGPGHVVPPPALVLTMPKVEAFTIDQDGVALSLGSVSNAVPTDAASVAAFEAIHNISLFTGDINIIKNTYRYVIEVTGELGVDSQPNAKMYGAVVSRAIVEQSEY